jgi:hypothetical protein
MFNEQVVELIAVMEWLHPGMQIITEIDHSGGHMKQCADAFCATGKRKFSINLFLLSKISNNDFYFFVIIESTLKYGGSQEVTRSIKRLKVSLALVTILVVLYKLDILNMVHFK